MQEAESTLCTAHTPKATAVPILEVNTAAWHVFLQDLFLCIYVQIQIVLGSSVLSYMEIHIRFHLIGCGEISCLISAYFIRFGLGEGDGVCETARKPLQSPASGPTPLVEFSTAWWAGQQQGCCAGSGELALHVPLQFLCRRGPIPQWY